MKQVSCLYQFVTVVLSLGNYVVYIDTIAQVYNCKLHVGFEQSTMVGTIRSVENVYY